MQTKIKELTFAKLVTLEPRLGALYKEAEEAPKLPYWSANRNWYKEFKPRMVRLVGFSAHTPGKLIHSCEAYDLAYQTISQALMKLESEEKRAIQK